MLQNLSNWGNYPVVESQVFAPADQQALCTMIRHEQGEWTARGNGRCYGDAALGQQVISTLQLRSVLHFDKQAGIVACESGVLFSELLAVIVPAGWFFHVTPGTCALTVGGAIACDVHGKNHPTKGCFSNWLISFELVNELGEIVHCSRENNSALFWQTCGGMGWTGIILAARFQLMRLESGVIRQTTIRAKSVEHLFDVFEENAHREYAAGWIDGFASGSQLGRGAVYFGDHLAGKSDKTSEYQPPSTLNVPFFAPSWLLNRFSIHLYNQWVRIRSTPGEQNVGLHAYFYPLDRLRNWNRLYGKRGFVQYQCCIPEASAPEALQKVLKTIQQGPDKPFLSVIKRHGDRPADAIHSFPIKGWSLALDFPRTTTIFNLIRQLDDIVWHAGGKIYLAKDAASHGRMGRIDPNSFGNKKFNSALRARIGNDTGIN